MGVQILYVPQVTWEYFSLPFPDGLNNGGFALGVSTDGTPNFSYSPIDLAVALLEGVEREKVPITNLAQFFDMNRNMISKHWVTIPVVQSGIVRIFSIAEVQSSANEELIKLFRLNAPLSMKWR
jgi:hypothetical protein